MSHPRCAGLERVGQGGLDRPQAATTGGSSLHYDSTAHYYVYNWA